MKSSKHVETCFVRANNDFDEKSTYIYCFLNKKKTLDKNPQKRTLWGGIKKYILKGNYCISSIGVVSSCQNVTDSNFQTILIFLIPFPFNNIYLGAPFLLTFPDKFDFLNTLVSRIMPNF